MTSLDEETGEIDGLVEKTAAVVAQVQDDADNPFLLEPLDELFDVVGGPLVETREGDESDFFDGAAGQLVLDDVGLGVAFLDADHVALEDDVLVDGGVGGAGREDDEMDHGALLAADHVDDLVEFQVDGVDGFGVALADGNDAVAGLVKWL